MALYTWTHGGTHATALNLTYSGTAPGSSMETSVNAWLATNNENGDTGTVAVTSAPTTIIMAVDLDNTGPVIAPSAVLDTIRMRFDYAVTNGPMAGGTAASAFQTSVYSGDVSQGEGAVSGSYDRTAFAVDVLGDTSPATLFVTPLAVAWAPNDTGAFQNHNRRVSISNLVIDVTTIGAPTLASVTPDHGSTVGGTVVTLDGTQLFGATSVTFAGVSAAGLMAISSTSVTCVTPVHAAGAVAVTVTTPDGSATL